MLRVVRTASLVLLAVIVSRGAASQPAQPQVVRGLTDESSAAVDLRPGMDYTEAGITVQVPPRGTTVTAEAIGSKGNTVQLAVETRRDGSVLIHRGEQAERVAMVGATGGACGDGAYTLGGARWRSTYQWYASAANLPSNISFSGAETSFKKAVSHIINAYNDCGRRDSVEATASYAGKTSSSPDVSDNAGCRSPDGRNEMGFKRLPSGYLAFSCAWRTSGGSIIHGDTAYNTRYKWYTSKPSGCYWRWSIESVATHELGHAFGLAHVAEGSHSKLTMSTVIYPCQSGEATLGLGDLRGLEALY
jgi:hypothetical protein